MSAEKKVKDEAVAETPSETAAAPNTEAKKDEETKNKEHKTIDEGKKSPEISVPPELPSESKVSADVVEQTEKEKTIPTQPATTEKETEKEPPQRRDSNKSTFALMRAAAGQPIQDLGKIKNLGQVLDRNTLH